MGGKGSKSLAHYIPVMATVGKQLTLGEGTERIGCSNLREGGGELGANKKLDLWLQLICTKLKLKQAI